MELEHSFTIPVPPERAWEMLLDVERVAPCMPGATIDSVEDDVITGRIKVKAGPVTLTYAGTARLRERDARSRSVVLEGSGRETRGGGTATATVRSVLRGEGGHTEVAVHTSLAVTGRPAQLGRGMLAEVGGRLVDTFAANLAALLASDAAAGTASPEAAGPAVASPAVASPASGGAEAQEAGAGAGPGAEAAGSPAEAPVDDLGLPVRATASLRLAGITTVGELAARDDKALLALTGVGPQTVRQIRDKLAERGLGGGVQVPAAPPAPAGEAAPPPAPAGEAAPPPAPAGEAAPPPASAGEAAPPARVAGRGTAAAGEDTRLAAQPRRPPEEEALELLTVAGLPVLKRILPAAGAVLVVLALIFLRARRRRAARRS